MDLDTAIEVLERHRQLPEEDRQAALDDSGSEYHAAKARGAKYLAAFRADEEYEARIAKQAEDEARERRLAQKQRSDAIQRLQHDLESTVSVLAAIDFSEAIGAVDARRVHMLDCSIASLLSQLGIEMQVAVPPYSTAIGAWVRGERYSLADNRRAQRDVVLEGVI